MNLQVKTQSIKGVFVTMMLISIALLVRSGGPEIRQPAVSGMWYPDDASELHKLIESFLIKAQNPETEGRLVGFVVPHAGYVYSGQVAAHCYKLVKDQSFDTVIILGNAHRVGFVGAAIDSSAEYQNPLGNVRVDQDLIQKIVSKEHQVVLDKNPHLSEHSIESQIPFLQVTLKPGFKILPILFGFEPGKAYQYLSETIPLVVEGKRVLIIASTDLTHFPDYKDACRMDQKTVEAIATLDPQVLESVVREETAKHVPGVDCVLCAGTATKCVMQICRQMGADRGIVLKRANSGDVSSGDRARVVGYGAVAFWGKTAATGSANENTPSHQNLSESDKMNLLGLARYVLDTHVRTGSIPEIPVPKGIFAERRGAFVTLHIQNQLRGCIGYILPEKILWTTVIENTINAAMHDPRFMVVRQSELDAISIEISVLTPPVPVKSVNEIVLGQHGIILKKNHRQAVFLPQVAPEQGWDLETTLSHLAMKAGLPEQSWKIGAQFEVFEAEVFGEKQLGIQTYDPLTGKR